MLSVYLCHALSILLAHAVVYFLRVHVGALITGEGPMTCVVCCRLRLTRKRRNFSSDMKPNMKQSCQVSVYSLVNICLRVESLFKLFEDFAHLFLYAYFLKVDNNINYKIGLYMYIC